MPSPDDDAANPGAPGTAKRRHRSRPHLADGPSLRSRRAVHAFSIRASADETPLSASAEVANAQDPQQPAPSHRWHRRLRTLTKANPATTFLFIAGVFMFSAALAVTAYTTRYPPCTSHSTTVTDLGPDKDAVAQDQHEVTTTESVNGVVTVSREVLAEPRPTVKEVTTTQDSVCEPLMITSGLPLVLLVAGAVCFIPLYYVYLARVMPEGSTVKTPIAEVTRAQAAAQSARAAATLASGQSEAEQDE